MRTEKEIYGLIKNIALEDERIEAAVLSGSRANPAAPKDSFQDYDICFIVTNAAPFINNTQWIKQFGDIMILQMPQTMLMENEVDNFTYLMQFTDGVRIDLMICETSKFNLFKDVPGPALKLLDKTGILKRCSFPSPDAYITLPPSQKQYDDCCNEFWWLLPCAAKGIKRGELPYAKTIIETYMRPRLIDMLSWQAGCNNGYKISAGKFGKYLNKYLSAGDYNAFKRTYCGYKTEEIWLSLFDMARLFKKSGMFVAKQCGYLYRAKEGGAVTAYAKKIRQTPLNAVLQK